jgi:nitroimidazol reductase NimA-like FMN-containing flavoprotein (pyridoxamine 5'-phosphate oxidase superfamily)
VRRKDRQMSAEFGYTVIDKADFGVVSVMDENGDPYGVALSMAREDDALYFHSAKDGKKVRAFTNNPNVTVVFVGDVNVPESYTEEELEELTQDPSQAAVFASGVFTTEYESAIVRGTVSRVVDEEEKVRAMKHICEKYVPSKMEYFALASADGLDKADVYRIDIQEVTAKRKKASGEEGNSRDAAFLA